MTVQTLAILVLLVSFFVMIFLRFPIAYAVGLSSVFCPSLRLRMSSPAAGTSTQRSMPAATT